MGPLQELTTERVFLVLCAFVSRSAPSAAWSASLVRPEEFIEVFVDTPVDVCMQRDPKGLYAKARAHTVRNVTGVDSPYEPPEHAELRVDTVGRDPQTVTDEVLAELRRRGIVPA
jgi:bifunctional enzyme CysN/CysC